MKRIWRFKVGGLVAFLAGMVGICHAAEPQFSFGGIEVAAGSVNGGARHGVFEETLEAGRKVLAPVSAVEVRIQASDDASGRGLMAKVYFFDENRRRLTAVEEPVPAYVNTWAPYGMPDLFPKNRMQSLFFPIPEDLRGDLRGGKWTAVAVFGNDTAVIARAFPDTRRVGDFDFPERSLLAIGDVPQGFSASADGGFIEHVARTRSKAQPQITMFFRLPAGVSDVSELNGLFGRAVLGGSVNDVREQFLREAGEPQPGTLLELAQKYKLGILYWGARTSWTSTENTGALSPAQRRVENAEFDLVAEGWARGLDELAAKHGIPNRNLVLEGTSQAGQWCHRLALRVPDRILAIHAHIFQQLRRARPGRRANDVAGDDGGAGIWLRELH